jgi:hypothetical protein
VDQRGFCLPVNVFESAVLTQLNISNAFFPEQRLTNVSQETPASKPVARGTVARLAFNGFDEA